MARMKAGEAAGLAVGLIVALLWAGHGLAVAAEEEPGRAVPTQDAPHLQSPGSPHPPYTSIPPTSGPHVPWLAPWGVHRIPIPWEVQVHNLEDGGVIIHYRCDRPCPDMVATLERLVGEYPTQVILTPERRLETAIALTAWGRIETMEVPDEPSIRRFIEAYRGIDHHPPREGAMPSPSRGPTR
jgi:hypothetical protein